MITLSAQNWVQKNNFPGVERYAATGFVINGKLYMGTGYNGVTMMNDSFKVFCGAIGSENGFFFQL